MPLPSKPLASPFLRVPEDALRGVGQIVLQNSPWTGLAILCGLLVEAPALALGCALGALSGNLTARLLGLPEKDTAAGLHGFNGALVGIAGFVFFPGMAAAWALSTLGAAASIAVGQIAGRALPMPVFTAPFVLVSWAALLALGLPTGEGAAIASSAAIGDAVAGVLPGIGQIVLAANPIAGALILLGIALGSFRHALWALSGSLLGVISGLVLGLPSTTVAAGLTGYSAALTAIALAGRGFRAASLGVALTLVLQHLGGRLSFPVLTAPFVLGTWGVLLLLRRRDEKRRVEASA